MIGLCRGALGPLLILAVTVSVRGQDALGPPPAAGTAAAEGSDTLELLPDLGKIGAEVGALVGRSWNPYGVGPGYVLAGFIDLPLLRAPGGKLSYEILLGVSAATSDPLTITDPLTLQAGSPVFAVSRQVRNRLRLLDASPFGLKYTITHLGRGRVRPYFDVGVDAVVVLSEQLPEGDASAVLAAGQAPELAALGLPTGQGNIEIGFHLGGGLELRVSRNASLNLDYRFARRGDANFQAASAGLGLHF